MGNPLMNENFNQDNNLIGISMEERLQFEILQQKMFKAMQFELVKIKNDNQLLMNEISFIKADQKKQKEEIINQYEKINYANQRANDKHVTQTSLGSAHVPKIGTIYMGNLLRKTGLALRNYSNTTPAGDLFSGKEPLVINQSRNGYISYLWHVDRTWKLIKKRLEERGLLLKFESCKSTDEIHTFIDGI